MKLSVTQNKIEITEGSLVNQGEYLATPLDFEFTKSYDGLVKYAVFIRKEDGATYKVPLVDDACDIPAEVLTEKGEFGLGVYAFEVKDEELALRYSPTPIKVQVDPGSYREHAVNSSELTPTETEILEQEIQTIVDDLIYKRDHGYFNGPKGDPGEDGKDGKDGKDGVDGKDGKDGEDGVDGAAATIAVGTVTTLAPGSNATVENAGSSSAAVFNFGIPQGAKGDPGQNGQDGKDGKDGQDGQNGQDGAAATIAVGTVTTLSPGSNATVENAGTSGAAVFNFGIPQGAQGVPGQDGQDGQDGTAATISVGTTAVNFGQSTDSVVITNSGTSSAAVLNFTFNFAFADGNNIAY